MGACHTRGVDLGRVTAGYQKRAQWGTCWRRSPGPGVLIQSERGTPPIPSPAPPNPRPSHPPATQPSLPVGEPQPEHVVDEQPQGLNRPQQQDVADVELDPPHVFPEEQDGTFDVLGHNLRTEAGSRVLLSPRPGWSGPASWLQLAPRDTRARSRLQKRTRSRAYLPATPGSRAPDLVSAPRTLRLPVFSHLCLNCNKLFLFIIS